MARLADKRSCNGCGACASVCPIKCIAMDYDDEGFLYPHIDVERCTGCGLCSETCPVMVNGLQTAEAPAAYAAWNKDGEIRRKSSSGGIFHAICRFVLDEKDGIIFAPQFDETLHLRHTAVTGMDGVGGLLGSKYLQSEIGGAYFEVEELLAQGRYVFFSGTPCQIGGLKAYLKISKKNKIEMDSANLLTQDLICHGVPSPKVFEEYINGIEVRFKDTVKSVGFRNKAKGWGDFSIAVEFEKGGEYIKEARKDEYMRGFLHNFYLRPSCHNCAFKNIARVSDITLADFWGINAVLPGINDDRGISLVLSNTPKGEELFEAVRDRFEYYTVDINKALEQNSAATASAIANKNREAFFKYGKVNGFEVALKKYCRYGLSKQHLMALTRGALKSVGLLGTVKRIYRAMKRR